MYLINRDDVKQYKFSRVKIFYGMTPIFGTCLIRRVYDVRS